MIDINTKNILIGLSLSIIYTCLILPKKEGDIPKIQPTIYPIVCKGMIHIPISKERILHLHHWIICLIILIIFYNKLNLILIGFLVGLCIQGLQYKDSFIIIKKKKCV